MTERQAVSEALARTGQPCPATPLQLGMLFHARTASGTGVDIEQIGFELNEEVRIPELIGAWQAALDRHDILRACFQWQGVDEPHLIFSTDVTLPVDVLDWRHHATDEQAALLKQLRADDQATDFRMNTAPLMRLRLMALGAKRFAGLWTFHHALLDGRSFPIILAEVFARYDRSGTAGGESAYAEPVSLPFEAFARHVHDQPLAGHQAYWTERLRDLDGPGVLRMPDDEDASRVGGDAHDTLLGADETERLRALARDNDVSLNTVIQAAWSLVVAHWCQTDDVVFGVTRACRHALPGIRDSLGLFINTVPMRVRLSAQTHLGELLAQVRAEQLALRPFETTPLNLIQRWSPISHEKALFNSMVMYDEASLATRMIRHFGEGSGRRFDYTGQTNFPLALIVYGDHRLAVRLEYGRAHFKSETAARMLDQFAGLLRQFLVDATTPVLRLSYLTERERALLAQWNATDEPYNLQTTLSDLFEQQVERSPDAVALVFAGQSVSYRAFNERVNQLAHRLMAHGVGPDRIVGIHADRSVEMLVAIHAAVKAGGAYVPLDPEHPPERLAFMLDDTAAAVVLTQRHLADRLPGKLPVVVVDDPASGLDNESTANPEVARSCRHLAYVLYTSGSTGRPKGVMNEHRGIVNRLAWMQQAFGLTAGDVVLQKTPTSFDVSVWELFWPLLQGARLVIAEPDGHKDTRYLADTIHAHGVTTLHFVPSMLQLFLEEPAAVPCASVRRVICSGEALPRDLQDRFFARLPNAELHNLYGPTEAAIDVSWWQCDPASRLAVVPIGRAIANTSLHVLDAALQQVPPGVAGELHIGGVQVARGYLNRDELTAEKFIDDPFASEKDARLYKTGDKARFLPDGNIDYLGRLDFQVKIRGFRIELGEIESVLLDHAGVREAVVVAREDREGDKRLVAYLVKETDAIGEIADLKPFLAQRLPAYMVPSAIVVMSQLPLSTNGKIDRTRLPMPDATGAGDAVAPRHETERRVAAVWQAVLGLPNIGVTDTFFDSGGDSLLLLRLSNGLSAAFKREIPISELLRFPTIERQAALLIQGGRAQDERLDTAGRLALQQRKALARRRQRAPRGG